MTTKITTHVSDLLAKLLEQYKGDPVLTACLTAYGNRIQEIEDLLWDLKEKRSLADATGINLDRIGDIVKQGRVSSDDEVYRFWILFKITRLMSQGTPEELIQIFKILTGAELVQYSESYPARMVFLSIAGSSDPLADDESIKTAMLSAKPAGVGIGIMSAPTDYFGFFDDPNSLGFSNLVDPTTGGSFAQII